MYFLLKILFIFIFIANSCVEPYSIDFNQTFNVLVVEAELTNSDELQRIYISNSQYINQNLLKEPILGLLVKVEINNNERFRLLDATDGSYIFPESFNPKIGDSFQLFFQKPTGQKYQSSVETLVISPEIFKVYDLFELKGTKAFGKTVPSNNVFVDFKDTNQGQNYYNWIWTLWEKQNVCFSNDFYDLYCEKECYEILQSQEIAVFDDRFYDGKTVEGKIIAKIPYYQDKGALLEIKQNAISAEAYSFYKQLQDLTQNNGTFADTPPQIIGGNITCVSDPNGIVVGMFMVKGIQSIYYWLDRKNAFGKAKPIGLLGRQVQTPMGGGNLTAACLTLKNRTPVKPLNWME
jgi:hypothetical protein